MEATDRRFGSRALLVAMPGGLPPPFNPGRPQENVFAALIWRHRLIHEDIFTGCLGRVPFPPYGHTPPGIHAGQNAFMYFKPS